MSLFSGFLARKYDIMQQEADNRARATTADVANTNERTRLLGPTAASVMKLQGAQAANIGEDTTAKANLNQPAAGSLLEVLAERLSSSGGYPYGGNPRRDGLVGMPAIGQAVRLSDAPTVGARMMTPDEFQKMNPGWTYGAGGWAPPPQRYARGTARVPGAGASTVDKVPALLAPDEAVLNQPAADMLGRGFIQWLNAVGGQKMGMP